MWKWRNGALAGDGFEDLIDLISYGGLLQGKLSRSLILNLLTSLCIFSHMPAKRSRTCFFISQKSSYFSGLAKAGQSRIPAFVKVCVLHVDGYLSIPTLSISKRDKKTSLIQLSLVVSSLLLRCIGNVMLKASSELRFPRCLKTIIPVRHQRRYHFDLHRDGHRTSMCYHR